MPPATSSAFRASPRPRWSRAASPPATPSACRCRRRRRRFPYGIYAVPEISTVGQSEEQVRESGVAYEVGIARFRETSRGHIMGVEFGLPEADLRARHAPAARRPHRRRGRDRAHPHRPGGDQPAAARSTSSSTTPSTIRRWPKPTRSPASTPGTGWGSSRQPASALQQPGGLGREIGEDAVAAGALEGQQRFPASPCSPSIQPLAAAALIIEYSPDTW